MKSRICAGIVIYNPDVERLLQNVDAILPQVEQLFLVDNNSSNMCDLWNRIKSDKITIIKNNNNFGIAKALNQMCAAALQIQFDWILTLDQDTICPNNLITSMLPYINNPLHGIICPAVNYEGWSNKIVLSDVTTYVFACMTTASLTRVEAWEKVGGFREDYFIDFVDNEFCMKLNLHNYKILRINSCVINHQLGNALEKSFLHLYTIRYSQHTPLRYYYMARNHYMFVKEYKEHLPLFKELLKLIFFFVSGLLFEKEKLKTIRFMLRGFKDANNNVLGEFK